MTKLPSDEYFSPTKNFVNEKLLKKLAKISSLFPDENFPDKVAQFWIFRGTNPGIEVEFRGFGQNPRNKVGGRNLIPIK